LAGVTGYYDGISLSQIPVYERALLNYFNDDYPYLMQYLDLGLPFNDDIKEVFLLLINNFVLSKQANYLFMLGAKK
jgi:hypothetical protein